ncbi:unnamed protein product, partial [Ascophyllum nodosum]
RAKAAKTLTNAADAAASPRRRIQRPAAFASWLRFSSPAPHPPHPCCSNSFTFLPPPAAGDQALSLFNLSGHERACRVPPAAASATTNRPQTTRRTVGGAAGLLECEKDGKGRGKGKGSGGSTFSALPQVLPSPILRGAAG